MIILGVGKDLAVAFLFGLFQEAGAAVARKLEHEAAKREEEREKEKRRRKRRRKPNTR